NLKPVGTGPYRILDFKPGDTIRAELNPGYHRPNWPFFDRLEMKGGGDAVSAARAVIQTGEYDFAWNMQVENDILRRMEQGGRGRVDLADSGNVEHIAVNFSDPWREVDGERSSPKGQHPVLSDPAVRAALALLVDRGTIQEQVYGRLGACRFNGHFELEQAAERKRAHGAAGCEPARRRDDESRRGDADHEATPVAGTSALGRA